MLNAETLVRNYLTATQERRLGDANAFLADGFTMQFPGGVEFASLEELVAWSRPRYRKIDKDYERFDVAVSSDGEIVYCYGTLFGEWPDGSEFSGIRFVDRFTVVNGKLTDQRVWNDLAESALNRPT